MDSLKTIFWNDNQSRLRAGLRVPFQFVLYFALMMGFGSIIDLIDPEIKFNSDAPYWLFLAVGGLRIFSALISVGLSGRFLDHRNFADFGFHFKKDWWLDLGFGMGLGMVLFGMIFSFEYAAGWITITDVFHIKNPDQLFIIPVLLFFLVFICVSITEETVSRGYLLKNLSEGFNLKYISPKVAIILAWMLSSIVFGLLHANNPNATFLSTFNLILGGIFLGFGFILTGELAIPIGIHITWNFFQGNVFGFPVSGLTIPAEVVSFVSINQAGPDLWTGGKFGPEAGLLGLLTMLIGIILTIGWVRLRRGKNSIGIHLFLADPPKKNLPEVEELVLNFIKNE